MKPDRAPLGHSFARFPRKTRHTSKLLRKTRVGVVSELSDRAVFVPVKRGWNWQEVWRHPAFHFKQPSLMNSKTPAEQAAGRTKSAADAGKNAAVADSNPESIIRRKVKRTGSVDRGALFRQTMEGSVRAPRGRWRRCRWLRGASLRRARRSARGQDSACIRLRTAGSRSARRAASRRSR